MEDKTFHIPLNCLFCGSALKGSLDKEYASGDMIKCQECGEQNDYDSLMDVAIDDGKNVVGEFAKGEIGKMLKDIFK